MSAAQREQLSALLEGIYDSFVADVAESRGRTRQEVLLGMILRMSLGEGLGTSTNRLEEKIIMNNEHIFAGFSCLSSMAEHQNSIGGRHRRSDYMSKDSQKHALSPVWRALDVNFTPNHHGLAGLQTVVRALITYMH